MKKVIITVICALICLLPLTVGGAAAKETESTSFVFEVDVNQRYTDIIDATDDPEFYKFYNNEDEEKQAERNRNTYIAVLVAALVVAVIILVVSLKRVPKEDEITIDEDKTNKKSKE